MPKKNLLDPDLFEINKPLPNFIFHRDWDPNIYKLYGSATMDPDPYKISPDPKKISPYPEPSQTKTESQD